MGSGLEGEGRWRGTKRMEGAEAVVVTENNK